MLTPHEPWDKCLGLFFFTFISFHFRRSLDEIVVGSCFKNIKPNQSQKKNMNEMDEIKRAKKKYETKKEIETYSLFCFFVRSSFSSFSFAIGKFSLLCGLQSM